MNVSEVLETASKIMEGHTRELFGMNNDLSGARLAICMKCPLYLDQFGGICNSTLYYNPETEDVSEKRKDGYYAGCGCRLRAKTTLKNENCPVGKW